MPQPHRLVVNGVPHEVKIRGLEPLSEVLRLQLGLTATKLACGQGECGACTVLIGGAARMSCITPAILIGEEIWTSEGLEDESEDLRAEFAETGAFQCGYCTPGQIVNACAFLRGETGRRGEGDDRRDRIRHAMSGNICRCTGYQAIVESIERVAEQRGALHDCDNEAIVAQ